MGTFLSGHEAPVDALTTVYKDYCGMKQGSVGNPWDMPHKERGKEITSTIRGTTTIETRDADLT